MNEITEELLAEFKEHMKLSDDEDNNLTRILKASDKALYKPCGGRNINEDETYKELVFERARYSYNNALEFFQKNFLSEINTLGIESAMDEMRDLDATIQIYPQIK